MPRVDDLGHTLVLEFPLSDTTSAAAKRAAYALMHRATVAFEQTADVLRCKLEAIGDPSNLERDFRREVVDHELRLEIAEKTESYRNAILGLAFSRTGLQG